MAKSSKQASGGKQGRSDTQKASNQQSTAMAGPSGGSAIAALKEDHRRVERLFSQFESTTDEGRKQDLIVQICSELNIHTRLEEEIFYPACREAMGDDDILDEGQVEHDAAKLLIADLSINLGEDDPYCDAKVKLLSEQIKHHVAEEEKPGEGTFAKAEQHNVDNVPLAIELAQRKQELQRRGARLRPTRAVSFNLDVARLMEEPGRGGRRYYEESEGRGARGRGGWFGDSEGHSRAARERWEDDDRRYRSRGRHDDDDDRGGRGHGGWFGDSEGHSRAARERWEDEDRRGYRSRSRYDDDDDGRGWHGDPRGHAEAARRGWSHRR